MTPYTLACKVWIPASFEASAGSCSADVPPLGTVEVSCRLYTKEISIGRKGMLQQQF